MIPTNPAADQLTEELAALLEEEAELLHLRLRQMVRLSDAIVGRGDEDMQPVLDEMEQTQRRQEATDLKLQAVRNAFSSALGERGAALKLSELIDRLPPRQAAALDYRRQQIILLAERLRGQHLQTVVLLAECARVNRRLMEGLFPSGESLTTYGRGGRDAWRPGAGLVDAEL